MFNLQFIILGVLTAVLGGGYFYLQNLQQDRDNQFTARIQAEQQAQTVIASFETYADNVNDEISQRNIDEHNLQLEYQAARDVANELADLFGKHELAGLARARPTLLERRINAGTRQLFDDFETLTRYTDTENAEAVTTTKAGAVKDDGSAVGGSP